jgi:hypothetical protein
MKSFEVRRILKEASIGVRKQDMGRGIVRL